MLFGLQNKRVLIVAYFLIIYGYYKISAINENRKTQHKNAVVIKMFLKYIIVKNLIIVFKRIFTINKLNYIKYMQSLKHTMGV